MDLILGRFADGHLATMDRGQLEGYGLLLEESDADIYDWLTGQGRPPVTVDSDLWRLLTASFADPIGKDALIGKDAKE
jgi:antitoxin CptB